MVTQKITLQGFWQTCLFVPTEHFVQVERVGRTVDTSSRGLFMRLHEVRLLCICAITLFMPRLVKWSHSCNSPNFEGPKLKIKVLFALPTLAVCHAVQWVILLFTSTSSFCDNATMRFRHKLHKRTGFHHKGIQWSRSYPSKRCSPALCVKQSNSGYYMSVHSASFLPLLSFLLTLDPLVLLQAVV